MTDIEIVIKLPENIVEDAKSSPNYYPTYHFEEIWKAIVNGKQLPKGHGDLIDIQDVMNKVSLNYNSHQIIDAQSIKDIIRTTKITIPTDKEEEEK